jgi:uncharacterized protein (TIGR02594 family)
MNSTITPYEWAQGESGVHETVGNVDTPRILWYHGFTALKAAHDEISWCSAFMCAAHEVCDIPSTKNAAARSWLTWGKDVSKEPQVGDVVILWRDRPDGWKGHVAFLAAPYKSGDELIVLLGGNQGNQVKLSRFPSNQILGFRRHA